MSDSDDGGSNSPLRYQPGGSLYSAPPASPAAVAETTAALPPGTPPAVVAAVAAAAERLLASGQFTTLQDAIASLQKEQGGVAGLFSGSSLGMFRPGSEMDDNEGGFGSASRFYNPAAHLDQTVALLTARGLDPALEEAYRLMVELQVANPDDPEARLIQSYLNSQPSWYLATVVNADQHPRGGALGMMQQRLSPFSNPLKIDKLDQAERGITNFVDDNYAAITIALIAAMTGGAAGGAASAAGAGTMGAGAVGGAVAGATSTTLANDFEPTGSQLATGTALGAAGGAAGGAIDTTGMTAGQAAATRAAAGAGTGVARNALTGGSSDDYWQSAVRGAISGVAGGGGRGMLPADMSEFDMSQNMPLAAPTEGIGPLASQESLAQFLATVPKAVPGTTLPVGGQELDITAPGAAQAAALAGNAVGSDRQPAPPPAEAPPPSDRSTEKQIQKYANAAKLVDKIYQMLSGGRSTPGFTPPPRQEGQTDEEYFGDVGRAATDYLGLDPATMREAGLIPGSPQYMDYILEQADAIIEQVFDDPEALEGQTVEEIQAALRGLNDRDAQQLIRALYVRGALGQMTSASSVTDPFTGISEELGMLPGEQVQGPEAARQRGLARVLEQVAGGDREALAGLFGRDADLFNMQANADTRKAQDILDEARAEEERRKRRRQLQDDYEA